jgi:hypothetical protein
MRRRRLVLALAAIVLAAGGSLAFWTLQSGSSEAELSAMHNCAPAGKWSIAVWDGESGTSPADALGTCGTGAVDAAYSLDPQTQSWMRWFAARPELNSLPPFSELQGVLALGSAAGPAPAPATPSPTATGTATPTPTPTPPVAAPQVRVQTVAEDDEVRNEGIMVLCPTLPLPAGAGAADFDTCNDSGDDIWEDFHASYKLSTALEGIPTDPTALMCEVVRKDVESPSAPQFPEEVIATEPTDVSDRFVCITRPVAPGVGVLDLYYTGPQAPEAIGAYELVVLAAFTVGSQVYYGTDVQDLCVLGWPFNDGISNMTFSVDASTEVGLRHLKQAMHPLDGFASCEDAALYQRQQLGLTIP